jgi:hypothetical protein
MNRLSLAELKAQKGNVIANLEAIKGGNLDGCHTVVSVPVERTREISLPPLKSGGTITITVIK